jgi:hypothetical protein
MLVSNFSLCYTNHGFLTLMDVEGYFFMNHVTHTAIVNFIWNIADQTELYRKFADEPEFRRWVYNTLFKMDYDLGQSGQNPT